MYAGLAALPELGQGAQPGNDPDGSGRNAADGLFTKSSKLSPSIRKFGYEFIYSGLSAE